MYKTLVVTLTLLRLLRPEAIVDAQSPPETATPTTRSAAKQQSFSPRNIVKTAMRYRPDDPWPRGEGHVVLALPGSQQPEKGYHEPGGSFSPYVGSFGVSIWVRKDDDTLKTTSDTVPIAQIRQQLDWPDPKGVPAVVTTTSDYKAVWTYVTAGTAALQLDECDSPRTRLELAVRSVGPAGGPIDNIAWNNARLTINGRWTMTFAPEPEAVWVGHEGDPGWKSEHQEAHAWAGQDGWGYARIELARGRPSKITLRDSTPPAPNPLSYEAVRWRWNWTCPIRVSSIASTPRSPT